MHLGSLFFYFVSFCPVNMLFLLFKRLLKKWEKAAFLYTSDSLCSSVLKKWLEMEKKELSHNTENNNVCTRTFGQKTNHVFHSGMESRTACQNFNSFFLLSSSSSLFNCFFNVRVNRKWTLWDCPT